MQWPWSRRRQAEPAPEGHTPREKTEGLMLTEQKPQGTDALHARLTDVQDTLRRIGENAALSRGYSEKGYEGQASILRELTEIKAKLDRPGPGRSMDTAALTEHLIKRGAKPENAAKLAAEIKDLFL